MSDLARLPLARVVADSASGRPGNGPTEVTDEHALLRLALWLADVSAEAALAATVPAASSTPGAAAPRLRVEAEQPPVGESAP